MFFRNVEAQRQGNLSTSATSVREDVQLLHCIPTIHKSDGSFPLHSVSCASMAGNHVLVVCRVRITHGQTCTHHPVDKHVCIIGRVQISWDKCVLMMRSLRISRVQRYTHPRGMCACITKNHPSINDAHRMDHELYRPTCATIRLLALTNPLFRESLLHVANINDICTVALKIAAG